MAKELYLYSPIYDFIAEDLIAKLEENRDEDIVIRANTPGGSVFSGWGIIAKMKEHTGSILMKVDGFVASMGTFILIYAQKSQGLDVSRIHLHRANMYVNKPEDQQFLDDVNKDMKAKLKMKINAEKLKELKGVTIEDIFNPETYIDVWLTAKEAKAVGLLDKIVKINPSEITAMNRFMMAAHADDPDTDTDDPNPKPKTKPKVEQQALTLEDLKAKYPTLYAQVLAAGEKQGAEKERERVEAWLVYVDVDPEAVAKGISEGKDIGMKQMAEFTRKGMSAEALKKVKSENAKGVETEEPDEEEKTDKEKEVAAFEAKSRKMLNLK